jgi:hypothetical protein
MNDSIAWTTYGCAKVAAMKTNFGGIGLRNVTKNGRIDVHKKLLPFLRSFAMLCNKAGPANAEDMEGGRPKSLESMLGVRAVSLPFHSKGNKKKKVTRERSEEEDSRAVGITSGLRTCLFSTSSKSSCKKRKPRKVPYIGRSPWEVALSSINVRKCVAEKRVLRTRVNASKVLGAIVRV